MRYWEQDHDSIMKNQLSLDSRIRDNGQISDKDHLSFAQALDAQDRRIRRIEKLVEFLVKYHGASWKEHHTARWDPNEVAAPLED